MTIRSIGALLGVFVAVCALVAVLFAGIDEMIAMRHANWTVATAMVRSSTVEEWKGFGRDSSAPTYRVEAKTVFLAQRHIVSARVSSGSVMKSRRAAMDAWVDAHPLGSLIKIRYNPAQPSEAEFADPSPLPRSYHPAADLRLAAIFGLASFTLLITSRRPSS